MDAQKKNLDRLRAKIDEIDEEFLKLLDRRASIVIEIGEVKRTEGMEFYMPEREREILTKLQSMHQGPFPHYGIESVFREIMSACLSLEKELKVAYLGPEATFSHLAALEKFGHSAQMISKKSIPSIFEEVKRDRVDYGVIPIENSIEGTINPSLDMFIEYDDLKINAEILLEVSLNLASISGKLEDVKKVFSHYQPAAQCRRWLETNLPEVPITDVASTALAAQRATEDPQSAAIVNSYATRLYGLRIIVRKIEDYPQNYTRFFSIGKRTPKPTGQDKTSIMFFIKDEVGILYRMLKPFAEEGINLTKIESRPIKKRPWEYAFFLDMEGHITELKVSKAIDRVKESAIYLAHLGSYPKG